MFDIAWGEFMLIGAVALIVIGPKDLPKAMRTIGQAVGKMRRMANEFQNQFNEAMREAELADLKKEVEDVGGSVKSALNTDFNAIEPPRSDFSSTPPPIDAAPDQAALKEAEAKLAALPGPEPLPEVVIEPAPVAEPEPAIAVAAKPKAPRKRASPKKKAAEPDEGSPA